MMVYQGVMDLQQGLSIAQENTLNNFAPETFLAELIKIVARPPLTDITAEIG